MKFILILWVWNSLGALSVTTTEFDDFSSCMNAGEKVIARIGTDIVGKPTPLNLEAKYTCERQASPLPTMRERK